MNAINGQPQTNNQLSKTDVLKKMIEAPSVSEQFKNALNENTGPFVASLIELFSGDSYLQQCEPKMVVMEALKAAVLKLPINKSLGHAYIIPYKSGDQLKPQFQIGYKGLIQLAMRTNYYKTINADVVYEGEYRSRNKMTGEFDMNGSKKSDTVVGYFAYFELLNGFSKCLYMSKEKVEAHAAKYSKSYNQANSPWKKEFDAMAIKTVLRNLLGKYGLLSIEMAGAIDTDPDQDVVDRANQEINQKANTRSMDFEEATVVGGDQGAVPSSSQSSNPPF